MRAGVPNTPRETVLAIFQDRLLTTREAAAKYGMSEDRIRFIRSGKSYSSITGKQYVPADRKPAVRLSDEQVREVFNSNRRKRVETAQRFNITMSTVAAIQNGTVRSTATGCHRKPTPKKRLTPAEVVQIRERALTETRKSIAAAYGITEECLSYLLNRKTWKNV